MFRKEHVCTLKLHTSQKLALPLASKHLPTAVCLRIWIHAFGVTNQLQASAGLVFPHIVMPHRIQVIVQLIDNRYANGHMQTWYSII